MKLTKCDLCGEIKESDEVSVIQFIPSGVEECCPCYVTKKGEPEPAYKKKEFDVCDRCAARILQAMTKKKVIPSLLTQEKEQKTEEKDKA